MSDSQTVLPRTPKRIGLAADHGGFESKEYLAGKLLENHYEVVHFGDRQLKIDDDYPDFIRPAAKSVASGECQAAIIVGGSGQGEAMAGIKRRPDRV